MPEGPRAPPGSSPPRRRLWVVLAALCTLGVVGIYTFDVAALAEYHIAFMKQAFLLLRFLLLLRGLENELREAPPKHRRREEGGSYQRDDDGGVGGGDGGDGCCARWGCTS
jgi:hypothetical protein